MTTAIAHPNIALIKYWGKQDRVGNLPATPNISITLDQLATTTTVTDHPADEFWLNGVQVSDEKVAAFLKRSRAQYDFGPIKVDSANNFPTGAGLASSASGFAALVTAINTHASLGMNPEFLSDWARQGSASAARSLYPGFVALVPPVWLAQPIAPAEHWPLHTVVAVTDTTRKSVSSSEGMERSRLTSPFYKAWVNSSGDDFAAAFDAINSKDFNALAQVAEHSCLKMHSVMLTSQPALAYWNPATLACMDTVRALRSDGVAVFFTIDAGPQVKAICAPDHVAEVESALAAVDGVQQTFSCGMGSGAHIVSR